MSKDQLTMPYLSNNVSRAATPKSIRGRGVNDNTIDINMDSIRVGLDLHAHARMDINIRGVAANFPLALVQLYIQFCT